MRVLVIYDVAGRCDRLEAVADRARREAVGAVFLLGNLLDGAVRRRVVRAYPHGAHLPGGVRNELREAATADRASLAHIFRILGSMAVPVYLIPGEHDAPFVLFEDALRDKDTSANIKLAHRHALNIHDGDVVAGFGGMLVATGEVGDELLLRFRPWEARVAFEHLAAFDPRFQTATRRILLFATPLRGERVDLAAGEHHGVQALNLVSRAYQPHLICCGGPHEGRGVETIDGARVVNPGSLASGSYAIVDLDSLQVRIDRLPEPIVESESPRTIIVALDGSPESAEALDLAARLARSLKARLTLMHAFEPVSAALGAPYLDEKIGTRIDKGEQLLATAVAAVADLAPQIDVLEGPAADAILRVAEAQRADLIVMGSRGLAGIRALLGSVSTEVMRKAPCPVLVAHQPTHAKQPEQQSATEVGV